ncbi:amino acid deaminase [Mixta theicola]|uniref:Amino acid deaminase n=1 Tax=Mixta theicola TaxID=1458355 RepID=A0A2K1Q969_9GAMM|nr:amino acid deaminase [Mixta theicola]PNS11588.1 amino acid deaminase [Mixta theicola]GLR08680.1 amino acid deaminase [Mixta theicola]
MFSLTCPQKGLPVTGRHLLTDISLPALVVHQTALEHNLHWMQRLADRHGAVLAPHGKTTMAPGLFRRQIAAGAWGITLATAVQSAVAAKEGIERILMANQLIGRANMQIVADMLRQYRVDFYCLVDSVENVRQLGQFFAAQQLTLQVLLELGVANGRCGCRSDEQIDALIAAVQAEPALELCGVEGYEGVINGEQPQVDGFIERLVTVALGLKNTGAFNRAQPLITASGSAWYDRVAAAFSQQQARDAFLTVMRPGCYLVHDHGIYQQAQQGVLARQPRLEEALLPAMEIFACVQSVPEPGRVIVALGKRDIAHDDMPVPLRVWHGHATQPVALDNRWRAIKLMDQHLFLQGPAEHALQPGDIIAFGASHPCLTFDKWRYFCLVNEQLEVAEGLETCF